MWKQRLYWIGTDSRSGFTWVWGPSGVAATAKRRELPLKKHSVLCSWQCRWVCTYVCKLLGLLGLGRLCRFESWGMRCEVTPRELNVAQFEFPLSKHKSNLEDEATWQFRDESHCVTLAVERLSEYTATRIYCIAQGARKSVRCTAKADGIRRPCELSVVCTCGDLWRCLSRETGRQSCKLKWK